MMVIHPPCLKKCFLSSFLLLLLIVGGIMVIMVMISGIGTAISIDIHMEFEDGRDYVHPDEEITITVSNLEAIESIIITGQGEQFNITDWSNEGGIFTSLFLAPVSEGTYQVMVTGLQDGEERTKNATFFVEAFELYILPGSTSLVSNATHGESTEVHVELVDWKGEPRGGQVVIEVTMIQMVDDEAEEVPLNTLTLTLPHQNYFLFQPPPVTESTLFRFIASYENYPTSECGIHVQPFLLHLRADRSIIGEGDGSINGPFLKREEIRVEMLTQGSLLNVSFQDLIGEELVDHTIESNRIVFILPATSIYQLTVQATMNDTISTAIMVLFVNDWPIEIDHPETVIPGEQLNVKVHREHGEFFAIRSFLFDLDTTPSLMIQDLIERGSSGSPYFAKGLMDRDGNVDLSYDIPTNARPGSYLLLAGVGSWDDSVEYHGISHSLISVDSFQVSGPAELAVGVPITIHVSRTGSQSLEPVNGVIEIQGDTFMVENGVAVILLNSTGNYTGIVRSSMNGVGYFSLAAYNHSLNITYPALVISGKEFLVSIANESGIPINGSTVSVTIQKESEYRQPEGSRSGSQRSEVRQSEHQQLKGSRSGVQQSEGSRSGDQQPEVRQSEHQQPEVRQSEHQQSMDIVLNGDPFPLILFGNESYTLTFKMHDHASITIQIHVLNEIHLNYTKPLQTGENITFTLSGPKETPWSDVMLIFDSMSVPLDENGSAELNLPAGPHRISVVSGNQTLYSVEIYVNESSRGQDRNINVLFLMIPLFAIMIVLTMATTKRDGWSWFDMGSDEMRKKGESD